MGHLVYLIVSTKLISKLLQLYIRNTNLCDNKISEARAILNLKGALSGEMLTVSVDSDVTLLISEAMKEHRMLLMDITN